MRDDGKARFTLPAATVHVVSIPVGLPHRGRSVGKVLAVADKTAIMSVPGFGEVVFRSEDMPPYVIPASTISLTLTGTNVGQLRQVTSAEPLHQAAPVSFMPEDDEGRIRQSSGLRGYRNAAEKPRATPSGSLYAAHAAQAGDRLSKVIARASASDRLVKGRFEALLPRTGDGMVSSLTNMLVALSSGGIAAWLRLGADVPGADLVVRPVSVDLPGMGAWKAAPFPFLTREPISWGWLAWKEEAGVRKIIVDVPTEAGTRFQARAASVDSRLDILVCLPPRNDPSASPVTFGEAHRVARELGIEATVKVSVDPSMMVDLSRACRIDMAM